MMCLIYIIGKLKNKDIIWVFIFHQVNYIYYLMKGDYSMFDDEIKINVLNNEIFFDRECWSCDKGRKEPEYIDEGTGKCEECNGTGFVLTDTGRSILDFIKRHDKD